MGGHFIQGTITAYTGQKINICIYTTPNYKIFKQDKYKETLAIVGLQQLLEILPLGVDLLGMCRLHSFFYKRLTHWHFQDSNGRRN